MKAPSCLRFFCLPLAGLSLLLPACGGGGPCAQRSGTYRLNATRRSGNCGTQAEAVVTFSGQPAAPTPPCTGTIAYSADNCEVTVDSTCPYNNGTEHQTAKATWNHDGSSGTTLLDTSIVTPVSTCQGTYDVTYTRL